MPTIQALNVYPVKSCRGIALEHARITETGFEHDRQWLIVDEKNRFLTQREAPRLALIEIVLDSAQLRLRAPGMTELTIDIEARGPSVEVVCWRDVCAAFDMGETASNWLSAYLGTRHRLVRFDAERKRISPAEWTGEIRALNQFSDAFPWLVISQASLEDLNKRLPAPLPMNRFRPNIVIGGVDAYAEDRIHEIHVGEVRLRVVKACTRCAITTTDQSTGERESDQPLRALKQYRFSRELKGVLFGQNAIMVAGLGQTLRIGQEFEIVWRE
jgi:uncharacterized protein